MTMELRERTEAHVRIYFEKSQDPEIRAVLHHSARTVEEAVESYRRTLLPGAVSYGRTIYIDGSYVGDIWCYGIDLGEPPNAMIGYCIFEKSLWGQGIGTKALGLFREDILSRFGVKSLGACACQCNARSLRVLEKNGFTFREAFVEEGEPSVYYQWEAEE